MLVAIDAAGPVPQLGGYPLGLRQRPVQPARERVHAIPDLVEEDVPGDERVALVESLLVRSDRGERTRATVP